MQVILLVVFHPLIQLVAHMVYQLAIVFHHHMQSQAIVQAIHCQLAMLQAYQAHIQKQAATPYQPVILLVVCPVPMRYHRLII